jgi:hypothetical protein
MFFWPPLSKSCSPTRHWLVDPSSTQPSWRNFAETRWGRIGECYALLEHLAPSALHTLNRALALAQLDGPSAGLKLLEGLAPPSWLIGSYSWAAVLADLHRRAGNLTEAQRYRTTAFATALLPSSARRSSDGPWGADKASHSTIVQHAADADRRDLSKHVHSHSARHGRTALCKAYRCRF